MKVKICGITSLEDAQAAVEAGADMLGFNFYPKSLRYIHPSICTSILQQLRKGMPPVISVGVFVNPTEVEVQTVLDGTGLDLAQLSGDEPADWLARLGDRAFKAVRLPAGGKPLKIVEPFTRLRRDAPPAFLLDSTVKGAYGGGGVLADWGQAAGLSGRYPFLLAGGLTPANVAEAVRRVHPWGVDVASGVESAPGKKVEHKVRQFIQNARLAESNPAE
jgi:phosphoribosylanthranilate isomerase